MKPSPRRTPARAKPKSKPKPAAAARQAGKPDAAAAPTGPRPVYVLSDSTAKLGRHVLTALLTQFPRGAFRIASRAFLDDPAKLEAAFDDVRAAPGLVFHAFVSPELKRLAARLGDRARVPHRDMTGPLVDFIAAESGLAPACDRRLLHGVDDAYERRIAAIDFTLEHDDGLGLDTLRDADVVLVGVSRTGKTPTSILLALEGLKTANVALASEVDPPPQLLAMPKERVVALVVDPGRLSQIRTRRHATWGMSDTTYNREEAVEREITWSRRLFARQGWWVMDVTRQAIEETAARVVERLAARGGGGVATRDG